MHSSGQRVLVTTKKNRGVAEGFSLEWCMYTCHICHIFYEGFWDFYQCSNQLCTQRKARRTRGNTRTYDVTDVVIDVSFYQTFPHRIFFPWGMNKMIKKPIYTNWYSPRIPIFWNLIKKLERSNLLNPIVCVSFQIEKWAGNKLLCFIATNKLFVVLLSKAKIAESNTFYSFFCFFYTMWLATYIIIRVVSARTLLHSKKISFVWWCFMLFVPFLLQSFLKKVYHAVPNKYMTLYPKASVVPKWNSSSYCHFWDVTHTYEHSAIELHSFQDKEKMEQDTE